MRNILTCERLKELLEYSEITGVFFWRVFRGGRTKAGMKAGSIDSSGHVQIKVDGMTYQAHRLAWLYVTGKIPDSHIDHINGVCADNRFSNIRQASHAQNMQNMTKAHSNNKSCGLLGVTWNKRDQRWRAQIRVCGKKRWIGAFSTPEDAHYAYINAKRELHPFGTL